MTENQKSPSILWTTGQSAKYLGVSTIAVFRLCQRGRLKPAAIAGKLSLFEPSEIVAYKAEKLALRLTASARRAVKLTQEVK